MAAIRGVKMSATSALTRAVNAVPMTTATARSITLPRKRKRLKSVRSFGTGLCLVSSHGSADPFARARPMAIQLTYGQPQRQSSRGGRRESPVGARDVRAADRVGNRPRDDCGLGEGRLP